MMYVNRTKSRLVASGSALALAAAAATLFAAGAQAQDSADATAASADEAEGAIIVTARRRDERLQDVPVSISVASADDLERQGITETTGLTNIVPNLQFATYGTLTGNNSAAQVFIRGIGQTDATAGVDPGVGLYIDDVYMGRAVGGAMDFRDIATTQVLRGPQGTLFGRNTIGGAVLISSNRPGAGSTVRVTVGEDSLIQGFAAVDLVNTDSVGLRVAGGVNKRDGYVKRAVDGIDLGDKNAWSAQATLELRPSDLFDITLRADYAKEDENGSPFVFLDINERAAFPMIASAAAGCPGSSFPPPVPVPNVDDPRCANDFQALGPFTNGGTSPTFSTTETYGGSVTMDLEVSEAITLKSITAYRELKWTGARDADNTPLLILATDLRSKSSQFSQELRANVEVDRLNGVIGVYYFDETTDDNVRVDLGTPGTSYDSNRVNLQTESFALFSEWSYKLTDALSLTLGARYTSEDKSIEGDWFNVAGVTTPQPPAPTTLCAVVGAPTAGCLFVAPGTHAESFESFTASGNISYRFSDAVMAYASYSQGFKSGGFNQRYNALLQADGSPLAYGEETAESFELGFKADPAPGIRVNGAVFSNSYDDIQLSYRVGPAPLLFNAGNATIKGAELELFLEPSNGLRIDAGLGYLDAKLKSVATVPNLGAQTPTATSAAGDRLPRAPEFEFHVGASYAVDLGNGFELTPRVDLNYRDAIWFDASNDLGDDSLTTMSASITLNNYDSDWRLTASVENLTDELYLVAGTTSASTATGYTEGVYARPRKFSLTFVKDF